MARTLRIRYAGAKYHVTVRGNGRQVVFHDDEYYLHFLDQLADALEKDNVVLDAYALVPNHYHYFGYEGNGSVLKQRQRLTELMNDDKQLSEKVVRIEKKLAKS